ncbi:MAG TPA: FIST C-terminal domain-containing protein [Gammaproteobacteria bacterium]|nr:FIST C-terminal domain-containing protein [Gammaproteobacteria bacterium]
MDRFLVAHASATHSQEALMSCLAQLGEVPGEANIGFVYATDECAADLAGMLRLLKEHTGVEHWVGTVGMGICANEREYYDAPALAVMVGALPPDSFTIIHGEEDLPGAETDGVRVAIVHGDPRNGQLPGLIEGLPERLGNGFLIGGLTSSDTYFYQVADEITEGQLSGVILDGDVSLVTGLTQGCTPISAVHEVTECQRNIAVRIDDRPALDVFYEDIGEILARDLSRVAGYIFAGFPVRGTDTGDYLVRNLIGIDPNNRLLAVGDQLHDGEPIMFCRRDGQTAVEDLQRMVEDLKSRLQGPAKGAVYYSCIGRGRSLFGDDSEELGLIADALGDVPLVGFYANGEISGNRLYGYTGVLTLFQ